MLATLYPCRHRVRIGQSCSIRVDTPCRDRGSWYTFCRQVVERPNKPLSKRLRYSECSTPDAFYFQLDAANVRKQCRRFWGSIWLRSILEPFESLVSTGRGQTHALSATCTL